jgi:hypothetical protein
MKGWAQEMTGDIAPTTSVRSLMLEEDIQPYQRGDILFLTAPANALNGDFVLARRFDGTFVCDLYNPRAQDHVVMGVVIGCCRQIS